MIRFWHNWTVYTIVWDSERIGVRLPLYQRVIRAHVWDQVRMYAQANRKGK